MNEEMANEVAELQIHRNTVEKGSALDIIREKELTINAKVLEARKRAEDIVAEARRKGVAIKEKAGEEGPKKAKVFFDAEVAKAEKEAEKIESSIQAETQAVTKDGLKRLDEAVSKVDMLVIP